MTSIYGRDVGCMIATLIFRSASINYLKCPLYRQSNADIILPFLCHIMKLVRCNARKANIVSGKSTANKFSDSQHHSIHVKWSSVLLNWAMIEIESKFKIGIDWWLSIFKEFNEINIKSDKNENALKNTTSSFFAIRKQKIISFASEDDVIYYIVRICHQCFCCITFCKMQVHLMRLILVLTYLYV